MQLTHNDVLKIIELLRINYDNAYSGYNAEQTLTLRDFWYESLKDYPSEVIFRALTNLIKKNEFAPRLANIVEETESLLSPDKSTDEELWAELNSVLGRAYDVSRYLSYPQHFYLANRKIYDIYGSLSEELKLFVVNASTLVELAEMSPEAMQYERSRFFKQMPVLKKQRANKVEAQKYLALAQGSKALPPIEPQITDKKQNKK